MKTRNGFVSNSSSSSFVIALKDAPTPCPHCGRGYENFLHVIERHHDNCDENRVRMEGADCILKEMQEDEINGYVYDADKQKELTKKIEKYGGMKGWTVAEISISYHAPELRDELDRLVREDKIKILDSPDD